jgi:hypothetical protein
MSNKPVMKVRAENDHNILFPTITRMPRVLTDPQAVADWTAAMNSEVNRIRRGDRTSYILNLDIEGVILHEVTMELENDTRTGDIKYRNVARVSLVFGNNSIVIRDCHVKRGPAGEYMLSTPNRKYTTQGEETRFFNYIGFPSREHQSALAALLGCLYENEIAELTKAQANV